MKYELSSNVALLHLDDGKANAVNHALIDDMNEGLDRAMREAKAVVIAGRPGRFSAGFDLSEFKKGPEATQALVNRGGELLLRIFSHSQPLVVACTGHAIAAGALMLLSADTRIGSIGDFKLGLNETAIGMGLPVFGLELASARLSRRHLTAAVVQSHLYTPEEAVDAGFLDELANADCVVETAIERAKALSELPGEAHAANKLSIRQASIQRIQSSLA